MDNALRSVLVPVYNIEPYLDKCIESIVNQTYRHLEIILIDDGSIDRSPETCDEWKEKDNRIIVVHCPHMGASAARNSGLDVAHGDASARYCVKSLSGRLPEGKAQHYM